MTRPFLTRHFTVSEGTRNFFRAETMAVSGDFSGVYAAMASHSAPSRRCSLAISRAQVQVMRERRSD
ncbi:hypothetical protein Scep_022102 [Stephania cephalantha]|uniref:Uncharacterized protein n=1 Tax=Stephania cephalantha TaxID=152367 RepID=A0AAP0F9T1_9MAGN